MVRRLYTAAVWLAQPLLRRKLARRAVAEPGYAVAVGERFGRYAGPPPALAAGERRIWIHAVSLGETRAAAILLAALRQQMPDLRLLLTHGTATGRAEGEKLLRAGDVQAWLPWDTPGAVRRFLDHFRPHAGILMETEVWPNLVAACAARGLPLVLANARLSERSLTRARRLGPLARGAYGALAAVWAQTADDAARLRALGAPVQGVFGNLKFDATCDPARQARGRAWRAAVRRPVVLLASSRDGEETMFLKEIMAFSSVVSEHNAIKNEVSGHPQWLVVPRHPQRFDDVAALIQAHGFAVSRRSRWGAWPPDPGEAPAQETVWLGDSLGEMALYYGLADVALLGGSFAPLGGQNLIEAAACGCPVIMGPHTFNFAEAAELARIAGAARRVTGMADALAAARALVTEPARQADAAAAARAFVAAHGGAAERTAAAFETLLARGR